MNAMHPSTDSCFHYLAEIVRILKSTQQYEHVLSLIVDRIVRTYACQTCAIALIDPQTEYLRIDQCHNLSLTFCNSFRRRITTTHVGQLLWTGKPVIIADAREIPDRAADVQLEHPFRSAVLVQIAVDQHTLGYLHVDSVIPGAFDEKDIEMLQFFADLCGIAVVKTTLQEENLRLERVDRETGLEKFGPFLEHAKGAVERADEFGEQFSLLLLDVDNFKELVNTYGYAVSRQVLRELGSIVQSRTRPVDAAARYGFDECILLLSRADLDEGIAAADELRQRIADHTFTDRGIHTTVSIGVGAFPRNGATIDALLVATKEALFEAQRKGRNVVFARKPEWHNGTMPAVTPILN
jgi:diguanylate cyclase (GGDEF)-like protein